MSTGVRGKGDETINDYEINRRLAEIAGYYVENPPTALPYGEMVVVPKSCTDLLEVRLGSDCGFFPSGLWSPLTDWSQLGPLMERFTLGVVKRVDGWESIWVDGHTLQHKAGADPRRAIALAIIAAHQEE